MYLLQYVYICAYTTIPMDITDAEIQAYYKQNSEEVEADDELVAFMDSQN